MIFLTDVINTPDNTLILLITLGAYLISLFLAIYFRSNHLVAFAGLLFLVPITMLNNIILITVLMAILTMHFVIAYFND